MLPSHLFKVSIRKNDQVQVISGSHKGKTGKVLKVLAKTGRILVEKVGLVKKHVRPDQKNPQGGFLEKESGLHYSNVLLLCPKCNRGVRHGIKQSEGSSKKIRFCKRCDGDLDLVK